MGIQIRAVMALPRPQTHARPVRRNAHFWGRVSASTVRSMATIVCQYLHSSIRTYVMCIQLPPAINPQNEVQTFNAAQFGDDAASRVTMETPNIDSCHTSFRPIISARSPQATAPTKRPAYKEAERRV